MIIIINMNETDVGIYESFEDMGLKDNILRGIYSYGFEKPSEIQKRGIVKMIEGRDIIAQAQSGTGKTATFTIGMLESLNLELNNNQILIMSHTRELSHQIYNVISNISKYMKININLSMGGISIRENIDSLKKNHILLLVHRVVYWI